MTGKFNPADNADMIDEILRQFRESQNPLRDFTAANTAAAGAAREFKFKSTEFKDAFGGWHSWDHADAADDVPSFASYAAPGVTFTPPVNWDRVTVLGFLGYVAARGWTVSLRRYRGQILYNWTNGRIQMPGEVTEGSPMRTALEICAKLAAWEPELMLWRRAFAERGVSP